MSWQVQYVERVGGTLRRARFEGLEEAEARRIFEGHKALTKQECPVGLLFNSGVVTEIFDGDRR